MGFRSRGALPINPWTGTTPHGMDPGDQGHMSDYISKQITLPGGRVIDIVYFAEPDQRTDLPEPELIATTDSDVRPTRDVLHLCQECASDLVYPVAWEEREDERWYVVRRCPECEWRGAGEHHQSDIEFFDDALNDGTDELLTSLRGLSRVNMEADIERLVQAINDDQILPMDF